MRGFISKLIDRNLQRKRESGITTYALYSFLFLLLYKLSKKIKILLTIDFDKESLFFCYVFNILVACIFIYLSFNNSSKNNQYSRILKKTYFDKNLYSIIIEVALIAPSIYFTSLVIYNSQLLNKDIEIHLWVLLALNYIWTYIVITSNIKELFTNSKIDISETNKNKDIWADFFVIIIATYVIIKSTSAIIEYKIEHKYDLFVTCAITYLCMIIIDKIIELNKNDSHTLNLENLEYEVYVKGLPDNEIREILQKNYMGYLLSDWIIYMNNILNKELYHFNNRIEFLKTQKKHVESTIDKQKYPIEYEGRIKSINKELELLKQKTNAFFNTSLNDVKGALKNSDRLDEIEKRDLVKLHNKLIETIRYVDSFKI